MQAEIRALSPQTGSSVQKLDLDYFEYSEASAVQSTAFWSTLASLKDLETVYVDSAESDLDASFLMEVSRMTQLR